MTDDEDLLAGRRRDAWKVGSIILVTACAAALLARIMTDDVHRAMFGMAATALALGAVIVVVAVRR